MNIRKIEIAFIALTLAFACFIGGYFTGKKGAVNIVTVSSQNSETQSVRVSELPKTDGDTALSGNAATVNYGVETKETVEAAPNTAAQIPGNPAEGGPEQPVESTGPQRRSDGRININTASRAELMDLSGIGEVLSERIIDYRNNNGYFQKIEDIMKVSGIGQKKFESIKDKITVD